jgi:hypothetical protein
MPRWISFYSLCLIVVLPSILTIVFNSMIFFFVRSSTRRVHAIATATATSTATATAFSVANKNLQHARDMYLVKHMVFIFIVFLIGWTPLYFVSAIYFSGGVPTWVYYLLEMLPVLSTLINILDLFMYNRDLRQYLKERIFKCLHLNRN